MGSPSSLERAAASSRWCGLGDQLELEVKVVEMTTEAASFTSLVFCRGKRVAKGRFSMVLVPTVDLEPIADVRHMFGLLYSPSAKDPLAVVQDGDA